LKATAAIARGEWLMFLRPGILPGSSWIDETVALAQQASNQPCAAVFTREINPFLAWLTGPLPLPPRPEQGLILRKSFYDELGGHRAETTDPEADLLRRIGRRRLIRLRTTVTKSIV